MTILKPLFEMNAYIGLFIVSILGMDKYKWSYGRQIRLNDSQKIRVSLPVNTSNDPDWKFMEYYIKSLPYSANLNNILDANGREIDNNQSLKSEKKEAVRTKN